MTRIAKSVARQALIIAGVACLWLLLFRLNAFLFEGLAHSSRAHWIFLPAALRIIALLLFDEVGAAGLVLGAYLTLQHGDSDKLPDALLLPLTSAVAPWIAIAFWRRTFGIKRSLAGLRPRDIVALSLGCAVMNSALLNLYLTLSGDMPGDVEQIATVVIGDALGTAIVLTLLSVMLSLPMRSRQARR